MTERRLVGSHTGGLCLFQVFVLSCSSIFCVPSASTSAALSFLTSFGYWNPSFPVSTGVRQKWEIMSEDFSFIKLCHILCSFEIDSLIILPLMFSILSKYRILFLKWLEQFFCSGKNITVTYFSPCLLLPGKVCHSHEALSVRKKNYSNYKIIIFDTTYHFGASRDFRRSHYVSHHKLYSLWHWVLSQDHKFLLYITIGLRKINGISKWKEKKEDSVAMLTALLQNMPFVIPNGW